MAGGRKDLRELRISQPVMAKQRLRESEPELISIYITFKIVYSKPYDRIKGIKMKLIIDGIPIGGPGWINIVSQTALNNPSEDEAQLTVDYIKNEIKKCFSEDINFSFSIDKLVVNVKQWAAIRVHWDDRL